MKKTATWWIGAALALCFALAAPKALAADGGELDAGGEESLASSWDQVIEDFLTEYEAEEGQITIGYYNTVTGEEHYYDPDRYMITGSMFKVPLSMAIADRAAAGEIDLEKDTAGGYRYNTLIQGAIVDSNNEYARILWTDLGGYQPYRRLIAPIMGEDPDTVDEKFYENNFFTARQMISCLKKLYDDPERYQFIIDLMKQAEPNKYFRSHEDRYEVAHKYGWLADDSKGLLYLNDCGIIYTGEPYLLVCFTAANGEKPYALVGNLCPLMSDYTQEQYKQRKEAEAAAEAERLRDEAQKAFEEAGLRDPEGGREESPEERKPVSRTLVLALLFLLCAALTVVAEVRSGSFDLKRLLMAVACILAGLFFWLNFMSGGGR